MSWPNSSDVKQPRLVHKLKKLTGHKIQTLAGLYSGRFLTSSIRVVDKIKITKIHRPTIKMSVLTLQGTKELNSLMCLTRKLESISGPIVGLILASVNLDMQFLDLNHGQFQALISILEKLNIVHLQCQSVRFSSAKLVEGERNISLKACQSLRTIKMIDCRDTTRFIARAVCDCPQLESVNTEAEHPDYRANLDTQLRIMALKLNSNFRLRHFAICDVLVALKEDGNLPSWNQAITGYQSVIREIIDRNTIGLQKCRQAIYHIFLIKRHSASPLFACLNGDLVKIIARLLYASRFTEAWYPLLKIT
jgi:hypothetical protein